MGKSTGMSLWRESKRERERGNRWTRFHSPCLALGGDSGPAIASHSHALVGAVPFAAALLHGAASGEVTQTRSAVGRVPRAAASLCQLRPPLLGSIFTRSPYAWRATCTLNNIIFQRLHCFYKLCPSLVLLFSPGIGVLEQYLQASTNGASEKKQKGEVGCIAELNEKQEKHPKVTSLFFFHHCPAPSSGLPSSSQLRPHLAVSYMG